VSTFGYEPTETFATPRRTREQLERFYATKAALQWRALVHSHPSVAVYPECSAWAE